MSEEKKFDNLDVGEQMTEEQREALKKVVTDQSTKLGEVFSQCWESKEFKQAFMEDPKAIFEEYEINYNKDMEYKVIDTPDKTIIHVLPYGKVKSAVKAFSDRLLGLVDDIDDEESKQILLPDWSWQIYQNTEDTFYIPIPICPEKLSPEELEMVNGGCLLFALVVLFVAVAESTEVATTALLVAEALDCVFAVIDMAVAALTVAMLATATFGFTGAFVVNYSLAVAADPGQANIFEGGADHNSKASIGNDPRKRGR